MAALRSDALADHPEGLADHPEGTGRGVASSGSEASQAELADLRRELGALRGEAESLREQLRAESARSDELFQVVAHELSTPITVIAGYNKLLLGDQIGELNPRQRQFLEQSSRSCQRLRDFAQRLAGASREIWGVEDLKLAEESLDRVLEETLSYMEPMLAASEIATVLDLGHGEAAVRIDRGYVEEVLANLICNAIKYAGDGEELRVRTRPLCRDTGAFIEVAVLDRGAGISPRDREQIFDSFVRLDPDSGREGLGLGLSLCRRIVEAHGGTISVSGREGGGSCFAFLLPIAGGAASHGDPA